MQLSTTYNQRNRVRQEALKKFGVNVLNEPVVEDDNIITCWNPSTGFEVAIKLQEKLTDKENTKNIKTLMGF